MVFPELILFQDIALLLLRIIVGAVFLTSGWKHLTNPEERGKSMGIGTVPAAFLGGVEVAASLLLVLGVYAQLAAILLAGVMLGAIGFKVFIWKTGFYAKRGYGWHYDALLLAASLIIITTGAGAYALLS